MVGWDEILHPDLPKTIVDPVVARAGVAGRGRETRLPGPAFVWILRRPDVAGGAALCRRSYGGAAATSLRKRRA